MKVDGGLRTIFSSGLSSGWHWQSVETGGTGLGVPDSNFCCGGIEGWVEYKQTDGWTCDLRPEQVGWITTRVMRGGRVFIATRRVNEGGPRRGPAVDELWIHRGSLARELKRGGLRAAEPELVCAGGPSCWDWEAVACTLLNKKNL